MNTQTTEKPPADPEPRPVVGYVWCPKCLMEDEPHHEVCQVRRGAKGKLYLVCPTHSIDLCTAKPAQDWVLRHMKDKPEQLKRRPDTTALQESPPPRKKDEETPPKKKGGFSQHIKDW